MPSSNRQVLGRPLQLRFVGLKAQTLSVLTRKEGMKYRQATRVWLLLGVASDAIHVAERQPYLFGGFAKRITEVVDMMLRMSAQRRF